jgi:hypothetical protein
VRIRRLRGLQAVEGAVTRGVHRPQASAPHLMLTALPQGRIEPIGSNEHNIPTTGAPTSRRPDPSYSEDRARDTGVLTGVPTGTRPHVAARRARFRAPTEARACMTPVRDIGVLVSQENVESFPDPHDSDAGWQQPLPTFQSSGCPGPVISGHTHATHAVASALVSFSFCHRRWGLLGKCPSMVPVGERHRHSPTPPRVPRPPAVCRSCRGQSTRK